ncbi:MAG TPA: DUF4276 family protein [Blastocatellia bacterium]|nr:DUF4276 family protein [Blastocatellia bacterium]
MVDEIRVYVEGGGDGRESKALVRRGFGKFFQNIVAQAREKRIRWHIVACGSRNSAFSDFQVGQRTHPDAFNILLVDAEERVTTSARQHLQERDAWKLKDFDDEQCHLMVHVVEAWLIGDIDALQAFYGQHFNAGAIPRTEDVEQIEKPTLYASLKAATKRTTKGEYHKIQHGPEILGLLDVDKVRGRAQHCERLFATLEQKIGS